MLMIMNALNKNCAKNRSAVGEDKNIKIPYKANTESIDRRYLPPAVIDFQRTACGKTFFFFHFFLHILTPITIQQGFIYLGTITIQSGTQCRDDMSDMDGNKFGW